MVRVRYATPKVEVDFDGAEEYDSLRIYLFTRCDREWFFFFAETFWDITLGVRGNVRVGVDGFGRREHRQIECHSNWVSRSDTSIL